MRVVETEKNKYHQKAHMG